MLVNNVASNALHPDTKVVSPPLVSGGLVMRLFYNRHSNYATDLDLCEDAYVGAVRANTDG
jgi:hypothetical protein